MKNPNPVQQQWYYKHHLLQYYGRQFLMPIATLFSQALFSHARIVLHEFSRLLIWSSMSAFSCLFRVDFFSQHGSTDDPIIDAYSTEILSKFQKLCLSNLKRVSFQLTDIFPKMLKQRCLLIGSSTVHVFYWNVAQPKFIGYNKLKINRSLGNFRLEMVYENSEPF